jgi:hypothetical protein
MVSNHSPTDRESSQIDHLRFSLIDADMAPLSLANPRSLLPVRSDRQLATCDMRPLTPRNPCFSRRRSHPRMRDVQMRELSDYLAVALRFSLRPSLTCDHDILTRYRSNGNQGNLRSRLKGSS